MIEPADLAEIFKALQPEDLDAVVVGGQAVNLWARRYFATEPELEQYLPFASEDLDFYGGRLEAAICGEVLGGQTILNQNFDPSPNAGVVMVEREEGRLRIDFLASVFGLSASEIGDTALPLTMNVRQGESVQLRVLHPVLCLEGKLRSAVGLPQQGRQDLKHLRISLCCVRGYLKEYLPNASERAGLKVVERVMSNATRDDGLNVWLNYGIEIETSIPKETLRELRSDKWQRFREIRLPQLEATIAKKRDRYRQVMASVTERRTNIQERRQSAERADSEARSTAETFGEWESAADEGAYGDL